jgi:hypothetical protein
MSAVPVAYIVFNRPKHTAETFAALREQRPSKLFIIADGPRAGHPTDAQNCIEVRKIVEQIDWPCKVHRNYAEANLGCKRRVVTGLDWVFREVERAIVLEDDCLPSPDFYRFCEALLERYADDPRVMAVTGNNFQAGRRRGRAAYYFSRYNHIWGWATWRRAWQKNDPSIAFWPTWKRSESWMRSFPDRLERRYWSEVFDQTHRGEIDTWDYQWFASVWYHGGLTATPNVNLVTNIGYGPEATHTVSNEDELVIPAQPLGALTHPRVVKQDVKADRYMFDHRFGGIHNRLHRRLLRLSYRSGGRVFRTVVSRAKQLLGDRVLGMMDYYRHPEWRSSWGGALNGQLHRQRMVEAFIRRLPLDAIVETGTYRGTTTSYLASLSSLPIYTVEYDQRTRGFASLALRRFKNVCQFGGDSRHFLRMLASDPKLCGKTILFYLDAHWSEDLPLFEELDIICSQWSRAVILIDDFQVPDDPGYSYDDYGIGKALDSDYIRPAVTRFGLRTFFPSLESKDETGYKRGSVTLTADPGLVEALRAMPEVRESPCESVPDCPMKTSGV